MAETTIHFEDHGQDFLSWTVDETGKVTNAEPFQSSIWSGCVVLELEKLKTGSRVYFFSPAVKTTLRLNHPVLRIEKGGHNG